MGADQVMIRSRIQYHTPQIRPNSVQPWQRRSHEKPPLGKGKPTTGFGARSRPCNPSFFLIHLRSDEESRRGLCVWFGLFKTWLISTDRCSWRPNERSHCLQWVYSRPGCLGDAVAVLSTGHSNCFHGSPHLPNRLFESNV